MHEPEQEEESRTERPEHQRRSQPPEQGAVEVAAVQRPAGQQERSKEGEVGEALSHQLIAVVAPEGEDPDRPAGRQADRQQHRDLPHTSSGRVQHRCGDRQAGQDQMGPQEQEQFE